MTKHLNHQVCQPNCPAYTPTNTRISEIEQILISCYHAGSMSQGGKTIHPGTVEEYTNQIAQLLADEVLQTLERIKANGHGGGNWRRLIETELAELERKESKDGS